MHIDVAGRTHTGLVRAANEDAVFVRAEERGGEPFAVLAVADGVGGAPGGAEASAAAMEAIGGAHLERSEQSLRRAIAAADAAVRAVPERDRWLTGASTTIVVAVVQAGEAWIAHVGDSRAYLVRSTGGPAERLTRDHSWVQEQVDAGRLAPEQADAHPQRNVITRALGIEDAAEPDLGRCTLEPGDWLLLCTDGLTEVLADTRIALVVREAANAEEAVQSLVQRALAGGGPDNVTVAVARREA